MIERPVMTYLGGKFRIADWIISHFPPHERYLEPFGGAANVLVKKPRAPAEIYNDLDKRVWQVFKVLQDRDKAKELEYRLRFTPYAREEWKEAYADQYPDDDIEMARHTIIRAFMSNGANGATRKGLAGFGLRLNENDNKIPNAGAWVNYPDQINKFCARLQGVVLENKDAIKIIKYVDSPTTLHYVDPPYMPETWLTSSGYKHDINIDYHKKLLDVLKECRGMVILSGYENELYMKELPDWKFETKEVKNQRNEKRVECLWINKAAQMNKRGLLMEG